jgi:hypothetical protein
MAATLEEIREKNRQLAEANLSKQNAINEVSRCYSWMYVAVACLPEPQGLCWFWPAEATQNN